MVRFLGAGVVLALAAAAAAQTGPQPADLSGRGLLIDLLKHEPRGFASAKPPWNFRFPADHAVHPDFWTELWHVTGGASTSTGRRYSFQLSLLRIGLISPATTPGPSAWSARDAYFGQFHVADAMAGRTHSAERLVRAAMGFAGAQQSPVRVWMADPALELQISAAQADALEIEAHDSRAGFALSLRSRKQPVTSGSGERGGGTPATNVHAYAMTRLIGNGTVRIDGQTVDVDAWAWLDRAWGRVPVPLGAVVWDRMWVQLADGRELVVLRMRRRDGSGEPVVTGTLIDGNGSSRVLPSGAVQADVLDHGTGQHGARYPGAWRLRVPKEELDLRLTPLVRVQEQRLSFTSWAGAMKASGTAEGQDIDGNAFVELAATP